MTMHGDTAPLDAGKLVFFIAWAIAMAHVGIGKYVIERLKDRHHATWVGLERPGIFIGGNARNAFLLWRFVTFGGYCPLKDDALDIVCRVDLGLQLVFLPLFVLSIAWMGSHR